MSMGRKLGTLLGLDGSVKAEKLPSGGGSGGGTTIVANFAGLAALTGMTAGSQAYVTATNNLYFYTGSGWFLIATVQNNAPSAITGVEGSYSLAIDGTATTITAVSTDPEGFPLTWSYSVTAGSLTNGGGATATVTQSDNIFTITPTTNAAYKGDFGITFTSSDGVSLATSASTFTLFARYDIEKSLRFNDNDSAYVSRTPSVAGNRKTWTWSGWVKLGSMPANNVFLFSSGAFGLNIFNFNTARKEYSIEVNPAHGASYGWYTDAQLRDPSSWYNIVLAVDTTQGSENDRIKLYLNGVQQTWSDQSYNVAQNADYDINRAADHYIGQRSNANYLDGYLAEVNFIDGQALTSSYFGEIDGDYGHWKPKSYSGTYGTNGFYLDFKDSVNLGNDASGNANDWTNNNLHNTDQMLDSPTNNFATLNVNNSGTSVVFSQGNLEYSVANSQHTLALSSFGMSSGKWYCEVYNKGVDNMIGLANQQSNVNVGYLGQISSAEWGYFKNGNLYNASTSVPFAAAYTTGDTIGMAFDADVGTLTFYKNNVSQGIVTTGLNGDPYMFATGNGAVANSKAVFNFGQDSSFAGLKAAQSNSDSNGMGDFYYTPPAGFLALCTQNLPEPTVIPIDNFNPVVWTGNGSKVETGFSPDLIWYKARDVNSYAGIVDVIRGYDTYLQSYDTIADSVISGLLTADSSGFTPSSAFLSNSYVAWNWKAGGDAVSNTNGSITSSVSANVAAGFSIATWQATSTTTGATVGHGLSAAPEVIIMKNRSTTSNWPVFHTVTGSNKLSYLNLTNQEITPTESAPTSSIFNVGQSSATTGTSGHNMVAYAFHSVEGYSKIGSYTGNGSIDGEFLYCGFKPSYVIMKTISGLADGWVVYDNARNDSNVVDKYLLVNSSQAEATYTQMDFLSNGFKFRTSGSQNVNAREYMFIAFAETPQKYSNAR